MTIKKRLEVQQLQIEALTNYCLFCSSLNETPRKEIVILINGCLEVVKLKETIQEFKAKKDFLKQLGQLRCPNCNSKNIDTDFSNYGKCKDCNKEF